MTPAQLKARRRRRERNVRRLRRAMTRDVVVFRSIILGVKG